jgi:hypothetical protein
LEDSVNRYGAAAPKMKYDFGITVRDYFKKFFPKFYLTIPKTPYGILQLLRRFKFPMYNGK